MTVHILRRAFRVDNFDDLKRSQKESMDAERAAGRARRLYRRMRTTPTRTEEILDGGSIYWVIKGYIRARQRILGIETRIEDEGRKRCFLHLDPKLVPTVLHPSKPRRGWRYLPLGDAPADRELADDQSSDTLPSDMEAELRALGLL
jgi:hypothetical protein